MAVPTTGRLGGITFLTVNGESYDIVSDANWNATAVKRETMMGQSRVEGYSEMPSPGYIGATIRDNAAYSVRELNNLTSASVIMQLPNGKTVSGDGMWVTEISEVKTMEGTFTVRFDGSDVFENGVLN